MADEDKNTYSLSEVIKELRKEQLNKKLQQLRDEGDYEDLNEWFIDQDLDDAFDHEELKPFDKKTYKRRKERQFKRVFKNKGIDPDKFKNKHDNYEFTEKEKERIKSFLDKADEVWNQEEFEDREYKLRRYKREVGEKLIESAREDLSIERKMELEEEIADLCEKITRIRGKKMLQEEKHREKTNSDLFEAIDPDSHQEDLVEDTEWITAITRERIRYKLEKTGRDYNKRVKELSVKLGEIDQIAAVKSAQELEADLAEIAKRIDKIEKELDTALKREEMAAELADEPQQEKEAELEKEEILGYLDRLKEANKMLD